MDKETKTKIKETISSSLKFIAPNTSKLIYEDLGTIKKTKFGFNTSRDNSDDGSNNGEFHRSYKEVISSSLNNINENEINNSNDDEPLFKTTSSNRDSESNLNIPYFNNPSSIAVNRNRKTRKVITNNFYANNKSTNITNKLLLNSMKANIEMQQKSTSAILSNMNIISSFQRETTLAFYNDVSEKLAYIGNSIEQVSRLYSDSQDNLFKTDRDNLIATIKSNGLMFNMLGSVLKDNYNNTERDIFDGVFKDTNAKKILNAIKGNTINKNSNGILSKIRGFDYMIGNLPVNVNYWLNSMRKGSKFKKNIFGTEVDFGRLLGNAFGMDMKVDKRLSTNKYEKGPIAYNGIANRAITNVIPSLLSKILSTLNNKEEIIYDYDTGKFTDKSLVREEREKRLKDTVKINMSGDIKNILGKDINSKDKELLENVFFNMASEGKTISDYKGSITGNKELDKKIRDYYNNPKYRNSINKNLFSTSTDMNEFFANFSKDLAGQIAMDYSKKSYTEDRKLRREAIKEDLENFEDWDESTSYKGALTKLLDGGLSKLSRSSGAKPVSGKEARTKNNSIYEYNDREDGITSNSNEKSSIVAGINNDSTINFLKAFTTGNAFNVILKGGVVDSIKGIVSTRENVVKDNNASYKENISNSLANDEDDAKDKNSSLLNINRMSEEQDSRIVSFEQRRDELLNNLENKVKDIFKNSAIGESFGRAKMTLMNTIKKTKVGKVFGKFFSSPQAVEDAGMTPVYVMGSAVGGMGSGNAGIEDTLDLSKASNFIGKLGNGSGKLLSSIGGKLSSRGGKLGSIGNILSGAGGKLSKMSLEKRARAALKSKDSTLLNKMMDEGFSEDDIANLADGNTAERLKNVTKSGIKDGAKNISGRLLSKGGSLATNIGGKLATKGGILGKAGGALGSLGTKMAGSGAGMLTSTAGTAGAGAVGSIGATIGGLASSAGGAISGIAASAGPALASLAPILGPVAVAGLATFALAKIGPKIVKGIANVGKFALDGIKGLGNKAKETAKGIVKGAGSVAKGAFNLGVKAIEYSPLGLGIKTFKNALNFAGDIKNKLNENKNDPTKSPYGDYMYVSNPNTTNGEGNSIDSTINPLTVMKQNSTGKLNIFTKLKQNTSGLLNVFNEKLGGKSDNSDDTNKNSSLLSLLSSNTGSSAIRGNSNEREATSSAKKLTIADAKKKGKYLINSLLTERFVLNNFLIAVERLKA